MVKKNILNNLYGGIFDWGFKRQYLFEIVSLLKVFTKRLNATTTNRTNNNGGQTKQQATTNSTKKFKF